VLGAVVLAGLAGTAGCGLIDEKPSPAPPPDPLAPMIAEAQALAAAYRSAAASLPDLAARLTPMAADHDAHAQELATLIVTPLPSAPGSAAPSASPSATVAATVAALRAAETAAVATASAACLAAPAGRVALLGSIAACRASHLEALP
jgi:hypothetical protein